MNAFDLEAAYQRAITLYRMGQLPAAAETLRTAIAYVPDCAPVHNLLGLVMSALGNPAAALEACEAAIRYDPAFASPYINRGIALRALGRPDAALASLDRAVVLDPNNANAHGNRASVLTELQQATAAVASFDRTLALNPVYPHARGIRLVNKTIICDWSNIDAEIADVEARMARSEPASPPWPLLAIIDSPALKRKIGEDWVRTQCPENPSLGPAPRFPSHERIRVGYFSADYHRHATAHLIAELFERHDRARFEIIAFSFGADTGDDMQRRIMAGCDSFIDVRDKDDRDVARLARELEIDIAVDLKGFTLEHRIGIFAHRAAAVQVNYLGYPGTLGAPYIDYILADNVVIPPGAQHFYTEKLAALPHCYQVNDSKRKVADKRFTRAELGLPETGFVFCCFNNNFKILPAIYDVWMRILKAVDGSVLWLIQDNPQAAENLRREAEKRGVARARILFAGRLAPDLHLARHKAADLFLDTLPYNAHTTASDSLWVGTPLLTCPGEGFAARVAASLLAALEVPELIAPTLADYETTAVALAKDPARLSALRAKIQRNAATAPLFDIARFTRDLESLYRGMMDRLHGRSPP